MILHQVSSHELAQLVGQYLQQQQFTHTLAAFITEYEAHNGTFPIIVKNLKPLSSIVSEYMNLKEKEIEITQTFSQFSDGSHRSTRDNILARSILDLRKRVNQLVHLVGVGGESNTNMSPNQTNSADIGEDINVQPQESMSNERAELELDDISLMDDNFSVLSKDHTTGNSSRAELMEFAEKIAEQINRQRSSQDTTEPIQSSQRDSVTMNVMNHTNSTTETHSVSHNDTQVATTTSRSAPQWISHAAEQFAEDQTMQKEFSGFWQRAQARKTRSIEPKRKASTANTLQSNIKRPRHQNESATVVSNTDKTNEEREQRNVPISTAHELPGSSSDTSESIRLNDNSGINLKRNVKWQQSPATAVAVAASAHIDNLSYPNSTVATRSTHTHSQEQDLSSGEAILQSTNIEALLAMLHGNSSTAR